jgi:hypothetical protein
MNMNNAYVHNEDDSKNNASLTSISITPQYMGLREYL